MKHVTLGVRCRCTRQIAGAKHGCYQFRMGKALIKSSVAAGLVFSALCLSACGSPTACYGLGDKALLEKALERQHYEATHENPAYGMFGVPTDQLIPILVRRDSAAKGDAYSFSDILFAKQDGTRWAVLSIYQDCGAKFYQYGGHDQVNGIAYDPFERATPVANILKAEH